MMSSIAPNTVHYAANYCGDNPLCIGIGGGANPRCVWSYLLYIVQHWSNTPAFRDNPCIL